MFTLILCLLAPVTAVRADGPIRPESKTSIDFGGRIGGDENGGAAGLQLHVAESSGLELKVSSMLGESGSRSNLKFETPRLLLSEPTVSQNYDLDRIHAHLESQTFDLSLLDVDGEITVAPKPEGHALEITKARAIAGADVGVTFTGFDLNLSHATAEAGKIRLSAGAAGGMIKDAQDGLGTVAGPRARITGQNAWITNQGLGFGIEGDVAYIYSLTRDVDHMLTSNLRLSYIFGGPGKNVVKIGPEAVFNLLDVKSTRDHSSDGIEYYVGAHVAYANSAF